MKNYRLLTLLFLLISAISSQHVMAINLQRLVCNPSLRNHCLSTELSSLLAVKRADLDHAMVASKRLLKQRAHVDPDPGATWSACQVTAMCSLMNRDKPTLSDIPRFLLDVKDCGNAPDANTMWARMRLIFDSNSLAGFSKHKAKGIIKPLQKLLRIDMAKSLDVPVAVNEESGEWCLVDRTHTFKRVLETIKKEQMRLGLVIYPGTPTLTEVRSLQGAECLVPYVFDNDRAAFRLDTTGEYTEIAGTRRRAPLSGGGLTIFGDGKLTIRNIDEEAYSAAKSSGHNAQGLPIIRHIPRLMVPHDADLFLLHVGFEPINECLIDHDLGNIVSKLNLNALDPLRFMEERFMALQNDTQYSDGDLEKLSFSELSLFHFSCSYGFSLERFNELGIEVPNGVRIKTTGRDREPTNPQHHPLFISDTIKSKQFLGYETKLIKAERGIRTTLRLFSDDANSPHVKFVISFDQWRDNAYHPIIDAVDVKRLTQNFLKTLNVYHHVNFCPRTTLKLRRLGITSEWIETQRASIAQPE